MEIAVLAKLSQTGGQVHERGDLVGAADHATNRDEEQDGDHTPSHERPVRPDIGSSPDARGSNRSADACDPPGVHVQSSSTKTAAHPKRDEHDLFLAAGGVAERVRPLVAATVEVPRDDQVVIDYCRERIVLTASSRDWSRLRWASPLVGEDAELPTHLPPDCDDFDQVAKTIAFLAGTLRDLELRRR